MALPMQPSASDGVWMRTPASNSLNSGPIPLGGGNAMALPTVNNPNLPTNRMPPFGTLSPTIPQAPFGPTQPPFGPANSLNSNIYGTANTAPSYNPMSTNPVSDDLFPDGLRRCPLKVPNPAQAVQNEANQRRMMQLEDESAQRRTTVRWMTHATTAILNNTALFHLDVESSTAGNTVTTRSNGCSRTSITVSICDSSFVVVLMVSEWSSSLARC